MIRAGDLKDRIYGDYNMAIKYMDIKDFNENDLRDLFLSVNWSSGNYPQKLAAAMKNSGAVFTAWDDNKLVGLINSLDDEIGRASCRERV